MKKLLTLLLICALVFTMVLSISACGSSSNKKNPTKNDPITNDDDKQDEEQKPNPDNPTVNPGTGEDGPNQSVDVNGNTLNDKGSIELPPVGVGSNDATVPSEDAEG